MKADLEAWLAGQPLPSELPQRPRPGVPART